MRQVKTGGFRERMSWDKGLFWSSSFAYCQVGTGAVWRLMKPKRSCRTPPKAPSCCGTALREITCSPSPPWRQQVPPTCGSSSNMASSSWTRWSWWSPSWSSSRAWSTWSSTTSSCPGAVTRRRRRQTLGSLRCRLMAQCSCYSPNPCTPPRHRCSTSVASPSTKGHGRFRICRCPTD